MPWLQGLKRRCHEDGLYRVLIRRAIQKKKGLKNFAGEAELERSSPTAGDRKKSTHAGEKLLLVALTTLSDISGIARAPSGRTGSHDNGDSLAPERRIGDDLRSIADMARVEP